MKHFFLKVLPYPIVFWIIVGFFGIIITDFLFMPIIAGHFKTQVTVPPVVGVVAAEAESVLTQNGLQFIWAEEGKYSSTIP